jgi:hypothetical protein
MPGVDIFSLQVGLRPGDRELLDASPDVTDLCVT